jgi:hypothetical protein
MPSTPSEAAMVTALLVDDEPSIRLSVGDALQAAFTACFRSDWVQAHLHKRN